MHNLRNLSTRLQTLKDDFRMERIDWQGRTGAASYNVKYELSNIITTLANLSARLDVVADEYDAEQSEGV